MLPPRPESSAMSATPRNSPTAGESRAWGGHLGFEGDDFEHHLNSEEASEDHVEDVHGIVKRSSLFIVLGEKAKCEDGA